MIGSSVAVTNIVVLGRAKTSQGPISDPVLMFSEQYITWGQQQISWSSSSPTGSNLTFKNQDITYLSELLKW